MSKGLLTSLISVRALVLLALPLLISGMSAGKALAATSSGSVGLEGTVPTTPPKNAPTITFPANNSSFISLPIKVSGLCQSDLLIKVFKNGIFGGSAICKNGSYSIEIDLFVGKNELVARAYDALDQSSPDSNKVAVNFPVSPFSGTNRISLSSVFAKKGAAPGAKLTWPIILSGGNGPYAISVDWGDGTRTDIISQEFPGTFDITHVYESAGIYNVLVRGTDKNGETAFLQLVGVGNGQAADNQGQSSADRQVITKLEWWPAALMIPLIILAFWLGRHHELISLKRKFDRN